MITPALARTLSEPFTPRSVKNVGCALTPGERLSGCPTQGRRQTQRYRPTKTFVYTHCLVCHAPFPENDTLENLPRGMRIAFDPVRGRLWAVCGHCKRWSLAPIEERWEALDELEKLVTDRSRLLSQTDNIALLRAGKLDVVRVGQANLTEEAWWRYGRELMDRRQRFKKVSLVGTAAGAAAVGGWVTGGVGLFAAWFIWENAPGTVTDAARWLRFGSAAWRGRERCDNCGHVFRSLPFGDRSRIRFRSRPEDEALALQQRCPTCGAREDGGLEIRGPDAERTLRRVLAYHHFAGASENRVVSATRLIEEFGNPRDLALALVKGGKRLGDLDRTRAIALEIAANESSEQRLLELELSQLEKHWRREEELAGIIDGELTPLPLLESLRRRAIGLTS